MSSSTQANRQTIREAFEAWQAGTGPITDVFAVDMVWRIEGRSVASKEYANRQQFIDEVLAPESAPDRIRTCGLRFRKPTGNQLRAASQSAGGNAALQLALQRLASIWSNSANHLCCSVQLVEAPCAGSPDLLRTD